MNILLDARDLINLLERSQPITAEAIELFLRDHNHELVLSFTSVRELVSTVAINGDFMRVRPWLQALEHMPHLYVREVLIPKDEIEAALAAYTGDGTYRLPEISVKRWDGTLVPFPGQESGIEGLVNIRLDDIVYWIYQARPQTFAPSGRFLRDLQRQVEEDRRVWRTARASAEEHFVRIVRNHSAMHGIQLPVGRESQFAEWIYESPDRCPGLQFGHAVYRALMENVNDIPETADFSDMAHVYAVPYVHSATLDRRMRHYCRIASDRMLARGALTDYSERLYENLAMFVARNL